MSGLFFFFLHHLSLFKLFKPNPFQQSLVQACEARVFIFHCQDFPHIGLNHGKHPNFRKINIIKTPLWSDWSNSLKIWSFLSLMPTMSLLQLNQRHLCYCLLLHPSYYKSLTVLVTRLDAKINNLTLIKIIADWEKIWHHTFLTIRIAQKKNTESVLTAVFLTAHKSSLV